MPSGTTELKHGLTPEETELLRELRKMRRARRQKIGLAKPPPPPTRGQKIADWVAATMGSWRFIILQSMVLVVWMGLNLVGWMSHWDPYPFILLNLALSFQAAYSAPFIMMSQNRQAALDRADQVNDYRVNIKAELEIELLHEKIDKLLLEQLQAKNAPRS